MRIGLVALVVVATVCSVHPGVSTVASGGQDWQAADLKAVRLKPSAFGELPAAIQRDLVRRGCTVPQPYTATRPENVIKGRFTSSKQTDWAVLCSVRRTSTILVFRGGPPSAAVELAARPDIDSLQGIGNGTVGYSRALRIADRESIHRHYEQYGGSKPPPVDHDGIDDAFIEKGSSVWYWYHGRWLQLTGSN